MGYARTFFCAFAPSVWTSFYITRTRADNLSYNSIIFTTVSSNSYKVLAVNQAFTQAYPFNITQMDTTEGIDRDVANALHSTVAANSLQRLENKACIAEYAQDHLTSRRDLLVVLKEANTTRTPKYFGQFSVSGAYFNWPAQDPPFGWICSGIDSDCRTWIGMANSIASDVTTSAFGQYSGTTLPEMNDGSSLADVWSLKIEGVSRRVEYCLSQQTPEHCKLQFNLYLMLVVMGFHLVKLILMGCLVLCIEETPLITIGDAIADFINKEDDFTYGRSLFSRYDFEKAGKDWPAGEKRWSSKAVSWSDAGSRRHWIWCYMM